MKNDKKFIGKKRKNDDNDNSEDNDNNNIDNNPINKESNLLNLINENKNNNIIINNDTTNNNTFISKKVTSNNFISSPPQTFTLSKNLSFMKDSGSNEINKISNKESPKFNNETQESLIKPRNALNNASTFSRNQHNNSEYSENSEDSQSSRQKNSHRNQSKISNQKFTSHSQSSRNTAFGLKEISKRVMEIIKQSGQTTYKAISDQIVNEINEKSAKDEKNIRRRIYDS